MKQQVKYKEIGILLILGFLYTIYLKICKKPIFIPCPFRLITGFKCPGCGITHMILSLLSFNIKEAYHYNPGLLILSPLIIYTIIIDYLHKKYASNHTITFLSKGLKYIIYLIIILLLLWGVVRNIYHI